MKQSKIDAVDMFVETGQRREETPRCEVLESQVINLLHRCRYLYSSWPDPIKVPTASRVFEILEPLGRCYGQSYSPGERVNNLRGSLAGHVPLGDTHRTYCCRY